MKRSRSLSLLLMGSMLIGGVGCSQEPKNSPEDEVFSTFSNIAECTGSGLFDENECMDLARSAIAQSPRFSNQEECEAEYGVGQCNSLQPASQTEGQISNQIDGRAAGQTDGQATGQEQLVKQNTGSSWMPLMMGFMAGRMLSGGRSMQGSQPLYKDPAAAQGTKSYRTPAGNVVKADAKGRVTNPSPALKQNLAHKAKPAMGRTTPKSSGGFKGKNSFGGGFGS